MAAVWADHGFPVTIVGEVKHLAAGRAALVEIDDAAFMYGSKNLAHWAITSLPCEFICPLSLLRRSWGTRRCRANRRPNSRRSDICQNGSSALRGASMPYASFASLLPCCFLFTYQGKIS